MAKQDLGNRLPCKKIQIILVNSLILYFLKRKSVFLGLIPRAIVHIFEGKEAEEDDDTLFDVRVSYIEIYNEEIRDLLGEDVTQKLEIKVTNVFLMKTDNN